jgi:diphthamide synthase subunit DPH2
MKIAICSSLDFIPEIKKIAEALTALGHVPVLPKSAEMVISGEVAAQELKNENLDSNKRIERKIKLDAIKSHYHKISECDAILVTNYSKKGIPNYIGGNTFLEIGFAHILNKKIFLLNPVPEMLYTDEIVAMRPTVLDNNLELIV